MICRPTWRACRHCGCGTSRGCSASTRRSPRFFSGRRKRSTAGPTGRGRQLGECASTVQLALAQRADRCGPATGARATCRSRYACGRQMSNTVSQEDAQCTRSRSTPCPPPRSTSPVRPTPRTHVRRSSSPRCARRSVPGLGAVRMLREHDAHAAAAVSAPWAAARCSRSSRGGFPACLGHAPCSLSMTQPRAPPGARVTVR